MTSTAHCSTSFDFNYLTTYARSLQHRNVAVFLDFCYAQLSVQSQPMAPSGPSPPIPWINEDPRSLERLIAAKTCAVMTACTSRETTSCNSRDGSLFLRVFDQVLEQFWNDGFRVAPLELVYQAMVTEYHTHGYSFAPTLGYYLTTREHGKYCCLGTTECLILHQAAWFLPHLCTFTMCLAI